MDIRIATTTFYNSCSELRCQLALQTVRAAVAAGFPVIIVDGSPDLAVSEALRKAGATVFRQQGKTMGASRREAIFYALMSLIDSGSNLSLSVILWTEPEKVDIVRHVLAICRPITGEKLVASMACRTDRSWETYPEFQQRSEREANAVFAEVVGEDRFDPMFGVLAATAESWSYLLVFSPQGNNLPDTYIQHYLPFLVGLDHTVTVRIDFRYPEQQYAAEVAADNAAIRQKRKQQNEQLTAAYRILGSLSHRTKHL